MVKVRIVGPIDDELREALMKLLGEAGCEVSNDPPTDIAEDDEEHDSAADDPDEAEEELQPVEGSSGSSSECDEDVSIVVLSPACLADGSLEKTMQSAAARGCHVVGIWPPGTEAQKLPQAFEDYGGDTVIWDPGRLRGIVSQPDAPPTWSSPDDQPRVERPLKRNKC
ncbi:hypothetical protein [Methylorubrum extorquens]|uniref:hypothetical protein n=1 Tax=Methylorubrum extorquens TaxID=408 RepID=UPI001040B62F|nr:hypothetical protein [Methylorubrum extorquens]